MTVFSMSRAEIDRLHVLRDVIGERISASGSSATDARDAAPGVPAAEDLSGRRAISAVVEATRQAEQSVLSSVVRTEALRAHQGELRGFCPTLAAEKLAERHELRLASKPSGAGCWPKESGKDRRQRLKPVHQPRHRRDCVGELIQIDGSEHWWFEDRGPQCTLLVFIDRRDQSADAPANSWSRNRRSIIFSRRARICSVTASQSPSIRTSMRRSG